MSSTKATLTILLISCVTAERILYNANNGKTYLHSPTPRNLFKSVSYCATHNTSLVQVRSPQEQQWLVDNLKTNHHYHLGVETDAFDVLTMYAPPVRWRDGSNITWFNWGSDQPPEQSFYCATVVASKDGDWFVTSCDRPTYDVYTLCEKVDPNFRPETSLPEVRSPFEEMFINVTKRLHDQLIKNKELQVALEHARETVHNLNASLLNLRHVKELFEASNNNLTKTIFDRKLRSMQTELDKCRVRETEYQTMMKLTKLESDLSQQMKRQYCATEPSCVRECGDCATAFCCTDKCTCDRL